MASIIDNIKAGFARGTLLVRLIYLNVAVFLLVHLVAVILTLWNIHPTAWMAYIDLPSDIGELLHRPWTLLTYMYVHYDVWHILFNMLWFYWFGNIFLQYFTPKQMGGLYLLGGLAGALFYVAAYNIFPYFADKQGMMCGASAAIMAVVLAITVRVPDYKVNLLFLGAVSLKYIAAVTILIDLFSMTSANAGGHIAHIGGAVMGILFTQFWKRGKDLTRPVNTVIDAIVTLFSRPRFKVHRPPHTASSHSTASSHRRPESDYEYNARKKREMEEIDTILDKIKKSGFSALTDVYNKRLFDAGKKN